MSYKEEVPLNLQCLACPPGKYGTDGECHDCVASSSTTPDSVGVTTTSGTYLKKLVYIYFTSCLFVENIYLIIYFLSLFLYCHLLIYK